MSTSNNTSWLGIDLAKETFDASVAPSQSSPAIWRTLPVKKFENSEQGIHDLLTWFSLIGKADETLKGICLESTGKLSFRLANTLKKLYSELPPASIINPKRSVDFARSLGVRDKTDRIDAQILAVFGASFTPQPSPEKSQSYERLRDLGRLREDLVEELQRTKNRLLDADDSFVNKMLKQRVSGIKKDIDRIEKESKKLIDESPSLREDIRLLCTIPGIGIRTATTLIAELGDLRRYSRTKIAAYVGLYPKIFQSGKSVSRKPRLAKGGGAVVRKMLFNGARSLMRARNNSLCQFRDRLLNNGKSKKSCMGALMRKLLLIARSVLVSGKDYDPNFKIM